VSNASPFALEKIRRSTFCKEVEWHSIVSSTNDRGMELAGSPDLVTPLLILAGEQTAGRGRGTNRWWSGPGALTFSLVFDPEKDVSSCESPPLDAERWPRVALVAGVALCDVLHEAIPDVACGLKWPNDVLLAGKKVAGILVEVPPAIPPAPRRLVLGMGVNVNNTLSAAPAEIQAAGSALCDVAGAAFDLIPLVILWLNRFADSLDALAIGDPALPARWQSLCALTGKIVELQSGNRLVRGLCRGIDADGALLVDTNDGPERLYAGALVRTD
jgi:BirA family biotin operon repressor/biotin-[acetyl-CoA-carboxylase] ligase